MLPVHELKLREVKSSQTSHSQLEAELKSGSSLQDSSSCGYCVYKPCNKSNHLIWLSNSLCVKEWILSSFFNRQIKEGPQCHTGVSGRTQRQGLFALCFRVLPPEFVHMMSREMLTSEGIKTLISALAFAFPRFTSALCPSWPLLPSLTLLLRTRGLIPLLLCSRHPILDLWKHQ